MQNVQYFSFKLGYWLSFFQTCSHDIFFHQRQKLNKVGRISVPWTKSHGICFIVRIFCVHLVAMAIQHTEKNLNVTCPTLNYNWLTLDIPHSNCRTVFRQQQIMFINHSKRLNQAKKVMVDTVQTVWQCGRSS